MFNLRKMQIWLTIVFAVSFIVAFSATDLFAQKGGKGRYRKVSLKKDARKNGYKITLEGNVTYFEAKQVEDPLTKKLIEALKELEYRCREDEPLTRIPLTFTAGNSSRVRISCSLPFEPKILISDEN